MDHLMSLVALLLYCGHVYTISQECMSPMTDTHWIKDINTLREQRTGTSDPNESSIKCKGELSS